VKVVQATVAGPSPANTATSDGLRAADRGLSTLRAVALSPSGLILSDIARTVGLAPSTALRHLRTLEAAGFVLRVGDRYAPGPELVRIAHVVSRTQSWARRAQSVLDTLADHTGESVYLAEIVDRRWAVYTAMSESKQAIRHVSWLGQRVRRAGSAVGAALAGDIDGRGVAVRTDAVEIGVTAISAPVHDAGQIVAAISVVGPTFRLHDQAVVAASTALVDAIQQLGATGSTM
jgi:DNA-binding IclR family transcriptional regulator